MTFTVVSTQRMCGTRRPTESLRGGKVGPINVTGYFGYESTMEKVVGTGLEDWKRGLTKSTETRVIIRPFANCWSRPYLL